MSAFRLRDFVKHLSSFGSLALINQLGAFFLIPVYWSYLDPDDYGVIGIFFLVVNILSALLAFGINRSVERFYFEWTDIERPLKIRTLWFVQITLLVLLSLIVHFCFFYKLLEFSSVKYFPTIFLAIFTAAFSAFQYVPFSILRVTQNIKVFGVMSVSTFILTAFIGIYNLVVLKMGVDGYILAQFISAGIMALVWVMLTKFEMRSNGWAGISSEIRFALPTLPLVALAKAGETVDKIILERFLSLNAFGLYTIAYRFGGYYGSVNSVLKIAYYPMVYQLFINDSKSSDITKFSLLYVFIYAQIAILALVLFEGVVYWFGDNKFYGSFEYIPFFILAFFIKGLSSAFGIGLDLAKKPHKDLYAAVPATMASIILAVVLIPHYGIAGALITYVGSTVLRSVINIVLAYRAYPRPFPWMEFSVIVLLNAPVAIGLYGYRIDGVSDFVIKIFIVVIIAITLSLILYWKEIIRIVSLYLKERYRHG